ncbi:hypothetical protein D3C72_1651880 [compost metagenome]
MNLVDEEHIVALQIGEQRRQVLGLFQHRAAGLAQIDAEFCRNDVRQGGLSETGRAKQQHMVECLAALLGRTDEDLQLLTRLGLAYVLVQQLGTQRALQRFFL